MKREAAAAQAIPTFTAATPDPVEQLQQFAQLRDHGILTPEEFEAKKAVLLSRM